MTTRELSKFHEEHVAKSLSGVRTANSGATPFTKADVIVNSADMIVECKTKMTECSSFAIQKDWLTTLEEERRGMMKMNAALAFSFDSGKNSYYVIDQRLMNILVEFLSNNQ